MGDGCQRAALCDQPLDLFSLVRRGAEILALRAMTLVGDAGMAEQRFGIVLRHVLLQAEELHIGKRDKRGQRLQ